MAFHNPVKVDFGKGSRSGFLTNIGGQTGLIICSENAKFRLKSDHILCSLLELENISFEHRFSSNPSLIEIEDIVEDFSARDLDFVAGLGGGSAMDVAKILSVALAAYHCDRNLTLKYLIDNQSLLADVTKIPCHLIPTTAGTGSEVTPFATVWDYDSKMKYSLSGENMYAEYAYVDPNLIDHLPKNIVLSTGLDAINQALESIWNKHSDHLTSSLAIQSVILGLRGLKSMFLSNSGHDAAEDMAKSSLLAGLAISHTRTALCHSISYPLTMHFGLPHGLACAFTMLDVLEFNRSYVESEISSIEIGLGIENSSLESTIREIFEVSNYYSTIRKYIKSEQEVIKLMSEMTTPNRVGNNIRKLEEGDLEKILKSAIGRLME
jgi:alcohol dehydrogenase